MDIPVFHLMSQDKAHAQRGTWALKGKPTHFEPSGCKKVNKVYGRVDNTAATTSMSIGRCFAFCSGRKGVSYFGLHHGNECWCASAIDAAPMGDASCDSECSGDASAKCGGIEGTSMFVMFDCTPATPAEIKKEKEEKNQALLNSYGSFARQSCSQAKDSLVRIDDKGSISGSVDTCKLACWEGKGAEECHGFTYDALTQSCKFHVDVNAGPIDERYIKDKRYTCYFKVP